MVAGDLIQEVPGPDNNRKEKYYSITPAGARFIALRDQTVKSASHMYIQYSHVHASITCICDKK